MASALYDKGRQGFLDGSIDWDTDTIKAILVNSGYAVNLATNQFLSDIIAGNRNSAAVTLANKTVTDGVADADDTTLVATAAVSTIAVVLYKDTGVEATSRLIAYIDTGGFPFTPSAGQSVPIVWASTANRIFKL